MKGLVLTMNEAVISTIYAVLLVIVLVLLIIITIKVLKKDGNKAKSISDNDEKTSDKKVYSDHRIKDELFEALDYDSDDDYDDTEDYEEDEKNTSGMSVDDESSEFILEEEDLSDSAFTEIKPDEEPLSDSVFGNTSSYEEDLSDSAFAEIESVEDEAKDYVSEENSLADDIPEENIIAEEAPSDNEVTEETSDDSTSSVDSESTDSESIDSISTADSETTEKDTSADDTDADSAFSDSTSHMDSADTDSAFTDSADTDSAFADSAFADSAFSDSAFTDSAFAPQNPNPDDSVITVNPVNHVNITTVNSVSEVNTINPEAGINDMAEVEDFLFENPVPVKKGKKKKKNKYEEQFDILFGNDEDTITGGKYFWYNNQDIEECKRKEDMYFYCHYFNSPEECINDLIVEMYDCAFVRTEEIQFIAYGVKVKNRTLKEILNGDNELKEEDIVKQPTEEDIKLIYEKWCGYVDKFFKIIVINAGNDIKEQIKNAIYEYGHNDVDILLHSPE